VRGAPVRAVPTAILRQYFPKGIDLSLRTQEELDTVAVEFDGSPCKTLNWRKLVEIVDELVADHYVVMTD
jgi:transposase, IS30 family